MRIFGLTLILIIFLTSCKEGTTDSFNLSSLPSNWVRLTEKDGKLIIYNSCDAGNLLLTLTKHNDNFELLLHGEQEDYDFEILESSQLNDTILINAKWKDSDEQQAFKFIWTDKQKGLGRWITTYSNGYTSDNIFVTENNQTDFETVDQPCRECWGDECDEMEKEQQKIEESKPDSISIPDHYDYETEVEIYYKNFIDKAYDKKKYDTHFLKSRDILDSLINEYRKKNAL